jgi:hypothetical protein
MNAASAAPLAVRNSFMMRLQAIFVGGLTGKMAPWAGGRNGTFQK